MVLVKFHSAVLLRLMKIKQPIDKLNKFISVNLALFSSIMRVGGTFSLLIGYVTVLK